MIISFVFIFHLLSRKVAGWTMIRKVISLGATILAWPLTSCSDPMSGFFATPIAVVKRGKQDCNAMGFKIGLELMVKCKCEKVTTLFPPIIKLLYRYRYIDDKTKI